MKKILLTLCTLLLIFTACSKEEKKKSTTIITNPVEESVETFSQDEKTLLNQWADAQTLKLTDFAIVKYETLDIKFTINWNYIKYYREKTAGEKWKLIIQKEDGKFKGTWYKDDKLKQFKTANSIQDLLCEKYDDDEIESVEQLERDLNTNLKNLDSYTLDAYITSTKIIFQTNFNLKIEYDSTETNYTAKISDRGNFINLITTESLEDLNKKVYDYLIEYDTFLNTFSQNDKDIFNTWAEDNFKTLIEADIYSSSTTDDSLIATASSPDGSLKTRFTITKDLGVYSFVRETLENDIINNDYTKTGKNVSLKIMLGL